MTAVNSIAFILLSGCTGEGTNKAIKSDGH